jgi:hypothetical protein
LKFHAIVKEKSILSTISSAWQIICSTNGRSPTGCVRRSSVGCTQTKKLGLLDATLTMKSGQISMYEAIIVHLLYSLFRILACRRRKLRTVYFFHNNDQPLAGQLMPKLYPWRQF